MRTTDPTDPVSVLPQYVDLRTLAARLGVTDRRVYDLVKFHGLPCVRFGAQLRFDPTAVARWLDARAQG